MISMESKMQLAYVSSVHDPIFKNCFCPNYPLKKTFVPYNQKELHAILRYAWEALICFFERCKYAFLRQSRHPFHWPTNHLLDRQFRVLAENLSLSKLAALRQESKLIVLSNSTWLESLHVNKTLSDEIVKEAQEYRLNEQHYQFKVLQKELYLPPKEYLNHLLYNQWLRLFEDADIRAIRYENQEISKTEALHIFRNQLSRLCSDHPIIQDAYQQTNTCDAQKAMILLGHLAQSLQGRSKEEKRSVVVGLVIAFKNCTDRILSDLEDLGYRYISHLFDPEEQSLEQRLWRALQRLRMQIFAEACRLPNDNHYATTYRYMLVHFTQEFGLKTLLNQGSSFYSGHAAKEKAFMVNHRFLQHYTPARIAAGLARIWMAFVQDKQDCFYPVSFELAQTWFKERYRTPQEDEQAGNIRVAQSLWIDDEVGIRIRASAIFEFLHAMGICKLIYQQELPTRPVPVETLSPVLHPSSQTILERFKKLFT